MKQKCKIRNDLLFQLRECEKVQDHNQHMRIDYDFSGVFEKVFFAYIYIYIYIPLKSRM